MARRKPIAEVATNTPAARKADTWAIERVKPYEKNAKKHPTKQVEHLAKLIRDHGFDQPIVVDKDGVIIKGHGRLLAAQHLKMQAVPVVVRDDLTEAQVRAARIADNKVAEMGAWDTDMLIADVSEAMELSGFDLEALGLNVSFVNQHIRLAGEVEEPETPPLSKKPVTKLGDVWHLGKHRLVCGDSTKEQTLLRIMKPGQAHMVFTDPPYGVDYEGGTTKREKLVGDNSVELYAPACLMAAKFSDEKAALYLWHAAMKGLAANVVAAVQAAGYEIRCEIVWNKNIAQFGALSAQYKQKHEPAYYCFKRGTPPRWYGPTNEVTVWDVARANANKLHPTQKPVELAVRALMNSTKEGDTVLDLFGGSGSTMMAAEQLGRIARLVELSPGYCDVIVERWETLTGEKAQRD